MQLTPEAIINDKVRNACIKRLKYTKVNEKNEDNPHKAAVLVPLCIHNGKLGLLYTLRSNKVSMNRGQVSFPGGMEDSNDKTLEDTALRETWEELQIPKYSINVWGTANLIKRKHVTVLPVLGYIGEIDPKSLKINKNEVEEAFVQPLEMLCDPKLCGYTHFRNSYILPTYLGGNYKIWGLTAVITHLIMNALVPGVYKHKLPVIQP
jgi:nudix motif 8